MVVTHIRLLLLPFLGFAKSLTKDDFLLVPQDCGAGEATAIAVILPLGTLEAKIAADSILQRSDSAAVAYAPLAMSMAFASHHVEDDIGMRWHTGQATRKGNRIAVTKRSLL